MDSKIWARPGRLIEALYPHLSAICCSFAVHLEQLPCGRRLGSGLFIQHYVSLRQVDAR